jgi:hypothetical protein
MPKIGTNWQNIDVGDIISFRYQSAVDKEKPMRTHTVLVLNPKYPKVKKGGGQEWYMNGLKLEESNISVFTNKEQAWQLLDRFGEVQILDEKNEIYRVQIDPKYLGGFGARQKLYKEAASRSGVTIKYRSYLWDQARKNSVFYEPIKLPKKQIAMLKETTEIISRSRRLSKAESMSELGKIRKI